MNQPTRRRRFAGHAFALLALGATAACGAADSSGPAGIAGTYTLQTVNNAPLPVTTSQDANYRAEILSWVLTLRQDNSYTGEFRGRSTDNGVTTINTVPTNGTYAVNGSGVRLVEADGSAQDANVAGNSLTMSVQTPVGMLNLRFTR